MARGPKSQAPVDGRLRSTLDHLLEGFQIIARDWTYLYVNPAAARQSRGTADKLVGRKMGDAYPGIDATPLFDVLKRCMTERIPCTMENHFQFPDGGDAWFELRIEPVPEGICIHSVDIQARKHAEAELRAQNERLEAEVAALTRER